MRLCHLFFPSIYFLFEPGVSDHLYLIVKQQIKTFVFVLCPPASSICQFPFLACDTPLFSLGICPSVILSLSLYVTPFHLHPSLLSSHSFFHSVFLLTLPFRTEPRCTHCIGQSLGSDVPCTHSLLLLSFFTPPPSLHLLQPAAKQTLPVPSIPTGGWESSLPEIAQIIALQ